MNILIIGSTGFIGKNLFDFLQEKNIVYGCDVIPSNQQNYFQLPQKSDFNFIFKEITFDVCINCAGSANVPFSLENPYTDFQLNTELVFSLLNSIKNHQPTCKFINLSSAAVYGNPITLPITEFQSPSPISPYGFHKLYAEQICQEFSTFFKIPTYSLRIFSVYGNGQRKQLFWDLAQKMKANKDQLTLFGTGLESRDFIHINDILHQIDILIHTKTSNHRIINIANGNELFIKDVVTIFAEKMNYTGKTLFTGDQRKGDPQNWCADISHIMDLGYTQNISIEQGLEQYATWINNQK